MGQLERYGLYVLCVVIFLILGVALWGGDPVLPQTPPATSLEVSRGAPTPQPDDALARLRREFSTASVRNPAPALDADLDLVGLKPAPLATEASLGGGVPAPEIRSQDKPSPVEAPPAAREYEIQKNDVLERIAREQLGSPRHVAAILAANPGLVANKLKPGTKIKLPAVTENVSPPVTASADVYVVKRGDVLETIAERHLGKKTAWRDIVKLNPGVDPNRLQPGTELKLPKGR